MPDAVTEAWIRNVTDEKAVAKGCRFDPERGAWTVFWIERYLRLYEGEYAGQPVELRGCHECGTYGLPPATSFAEWDQAAIAAALERATKFAACVAAGHFVDWQYDSTMRLFSWVRMSDRWKREIRRFRQGSIFVAKKCKKSPTLAAWSLYLVCGDGEQGQKVFQCAKDGQQARKIAGEHAMQMLLQSPDLSAECTPNRTTYRISHHPTRSYMEPLSSSNTRTQESKEGLNGSVMIDEVHVVDRDFVRRINRAGISRSEPLQIEVSTAGNNPDSYGKERFDYAMQVQAGTQENQELFIAIYAAPQDLTDADLDADPEKYGRMANPAWGHTVDPEEYLKDYQESKRSIQSLLDFKMYRLNIWQRTSNPWLKAGDWESCRREFTAGTLVLGGINELKGRRCYAGLDLSRTRDMSALVLVFPWPEGGEEVFRILPFFWMPEERAKEINSKVSVLAWQKDGHIELTPGGVTDYGFIKARFRELHKLFDIRELAYDPKFAEEVTQSLSEGTLDPSGVTVEEGTGVPRFLFDQNDNNFAAPTVDFERLVIAGNLHHNGHPVMAWQVGHAHAVVRASKIKRIVKPSRDSNDHRTIDGVIAGIMALARAMIKPVDEEWYTPGMLKD